MKVFEFYGTQYIVAANEADARAEYTSMFSSDDVACRELSDTELDTCTIQITDENDVWTGDSETFREHLTELSAGISGWDGSAFFLCGEE